MSPRVDLSKIALSDLMHEIDRRQGIELVEEKDEGYLRGFQHCDECVMFVVRHDLRDDEVYNPCSLGRRMRFLLPDSPTDTDYGFYRKSCKDFSLAPTVEERTR